MTLSGGCRPPNPPLLFFSKNDVFWLKLALFPSTPRKLSLLPLDRARRCDSDAPIESSVAQLFALFSPVHVICFKKHPSIFFVL